MPQFRLRMSSEDFDKLRQLVLADMPREAGAFALAGISRHGGCDDILVRRVLEVPRELIFRQEELRLGVCSRAINGLASLCEQNALGAVVCHSHPVDSPYSGSDDFGERRIFDVLRSFVPAGAPTASLLVWPEGIRGRVWLPGAREAVPLSEVTVVGRRIERLTESRNAGRRGTPPGAGLHSRQVLAFGADGQYLAQTARVGIVGVGGTGSAVAEQLCRLGVEDLILLDPDVLEPSNVSRVYGSFLRAVSGWRHMFTRSRSYKVDIVAEHLANINPDVRVMAIAKSVVQKDAALSLLDRDVVFLCTDEHWGRSVVTQIAYQYLIPAINVGMRITSSHGRITAGVGDVDVLRPGNPCLWCRQVLDAGRIAAESMSREEREALEGEGYVEGLDTPTPSVISVTTMVASMAVTLFLQLLTDFMGPSGQITNLKYDLMKPALTRGTAPTRQRCLCRSVKGYGDLKSVATVF